jgi:hypothetical protein
VTNTIAADLSKRFLIKMSASLVHIIIYSKPAENYKGFLVSSLKKRGTF